MQADAVSHLDPRRRAGDTVGALARDALELAADFLESVRTDDADHRRRTRDEARVCRAVGGAVARAPLGDAYRVLKPDDLDGRFFTRTERIVTNTEVALYLLDHAAGLMQALPAVDGALANQLRAQARALQQVERLVRVAPNATLGARLDELLPLLRRLERPTDGERPFPPLLIDGVTADPVFHAAAQDAYRIVVGRELDDLPAMAAAVWSGKLALAWLKVRDTGQPLTRDEAARIRQALDQPQGSWSRAPLLAGDWRDLDPDTGASVLRLIGVHHRVGANRTPLPLAAFCDRVRSRPLVCFDGAMLIETQGRLTGGVTGIAAFVLTGEQVVAVDGGSAWIHDLNDVSGSHLRTPEARLDYVRLFMNSVRHDGELFQPLEAVEALAHRVVRPETLGDLLGSYARPITPAGFDEEGRWLFALTVCYRQALFEAKLALTPDGILEMVGDDLLLENVPVRSERMEGLFVTADLETPAPCP